MPLTADQLSGEVEDLYWKAVHREVCNMILFFLEIQADKGILEIPDELPDCSRFREMFDVWVGSQSKKAFNTQRLFDRTIEKAKGWYNVDATLQLARQILQSSSLLDIDILYEPPLRSVSENTRHEPIAIERIEVESEAGRDPLTALRSINCSTCASFIRGTMYFECERGCVESKVCQYPTALYDESGIFEMFEQPVESCESTPPRLCRACIAKDVGFKTCARDHFAKVSRQIEQSEDLVNFRRELKHVESGTSRRPQYRSKVQTCLASAIRNRQKIAYVSTSASALVDLANSRIAPSGAFHLALMYGPLIFESGVPGTKSGIMISARPHPQLFREYNVSNALVDDLCIQDAKEATNTSIVLYRDKVSNKPCLRQQETPSTSRSTLCSVKRVYGAAFSAYPTVPGKPESSVLTTLINEAQKCKFKPSKTVRSRRQQLHRSSEIVTEVIKELLGTEVKKFIHRTASMLLRPDTNLTWHAIGNNCQRLIDQLLSGKDFEYVFPRLPTDFISRRSADMWNEVPWPRYLISFGDRVEGREISPYQPNSTIAGFCHQPHFDIDVIDFLEIAIDQGEGVSGSTIFNYLSELALICPRPTHKNYSKEFLNALWDLPRDTLSILQFHLMRPSSKYSTISGQTLDEAQWLSSRMRALQQLDIVAAYTGALGSALLDLFLEEPEMTSHVIIPKSRVFGSLRADEKVRIVGSGSNVGYFIAHRREATVPKRTLPEIATRGLQKQVMKSAATSLSKQRMLPLSILATARHHLTLNSSRPTFIADDMMLSSPLYSPGIIGGAGTTVLSILDTILKFNLHAYQVACRDNWIYVNIGDVYLAYQFLGRSKNIRKKPRTRATRNT